MNEHDALVYVRVLTDESDLSGTTEYMCSTCCGSPRYRIGDRRICSRHIGTALNEKAVTGKLSR